MTDEQKQKKAERNRRYRQRKKAILTHLPDVVDLVPPDPARLAPKAAQEEPFNKQFHANPTPEDEEKWRQAPSSEKIRPLPRAPEPYTKDYKPIKDGSVYVVVDRRKDRISEYYHGYNDAFTTDLAQAVHYSNPDLAFDYVAAHPDKNLCVLRVTPAPEDNPYPEPYTKEEIELVAKSFDEASDAIEYAAERRERVENQMKQLAKIRCNANELLWAVLREIKLLRLDLGAIHHLHVD